MARIVAVLALAISGALVSPAQETRPCSASDARQQWALTPAGQFVCKGTANVLAVDHCSIDAKIVPVHMSTANRSSCPGGANLQWTFDAQTGYFRSRAPNEYNPGAQACLTPAHVTGPGVNVFPCGTDNTRWSWDAAAGTLRNGATKQCLADTSAAPWHGNITIDPGRVGRRFEGVGGLAAVGGARLLYEYAKPIRDEVLDLMFKPNYGAQYHILKVEIEGDTDSSYGSGPSFMHVRDPAQADWSRGIYLPWLIKEAKKRNPDIKLYCLSWGVPHWIGNGTFFSKDNVDYHVSYMAGAKRVHGYDFDYAGIWNENAFSKQYVKDLRAAMDKEGLAAKIVVPDGTGKCTDCASGRQDIVSALRDDAELRKAVFAMGVHGHDVEGVETLPYWEDMKNLTYFNSEQNMVDGPMPQWAPTEQNKYGAGLAWPRLFLLNYIRSNATATIICPLSHSWSWTRGENNHGTAQIVEPWSGHYQLGSAFWSQAQVTQFALPGWHFLDGNATQQVCSTATDSADCDLVYATFVSTPLAATVPANFSTVFVNTGTADQPVRVALTGRLAGDHGGRALHAWETSEASYFAAQPAVAVGLDGVFSTTVRAQTVLTVTSLATGRHGQATVSPRAEFPMPYTESFDALIPGRPGRLLSDMYGAFEVVACPRGGGQCLQQAAAQNPGANNWHDFSNTPFTTLPSGTNFANVELSFTAMVQAAADTISACCRSPLWQPYSYRGPGPLGACFSLNGSGAWSLNEANHTHRRPLAAGQLPGPITGMKPTNVSMGFVDDGVAVRVNGQLVAAESGLLLSAGACGFGTGWHYGWFDDVELRASPNHGRPADPSLLFDLLPGALRATNFSGWAGMILHPQSPLVVTALGRLWLRGNSRAHKLDLIDASTSRSVLAKPVVLAMANCTTDLLGFCYAALPAPVRLSPGQSLYLVATEATGEDAFLSVLDASWATSHSHRNALSIMSYDASRVIVAGRVSATTATGGEAAPRSSWVPVLERNTAFGPLNVLLQQ